MKAPISIISDFTNFTEFDFPLEHFGVADKFLLGKVAREIAKIYRDNSPKKEFERTYKQTLDIIKTFEEEYNFKASERYDFKNLRY